MRYSDREIVNYIADYYDCAKGITSLCLHGGLAFATSGASLPFTVLLSAVSFIARDDAANYTGGSVWENKFAAEKLKDKKYPFLKACLYGAGQSVWQMFTRPIAYAAIAVGAVLDGMKATVQAIPEIVTPLVHENPDVGRNQFSTREKQSMVFTNSICDVFWKVGSISPKRYDHSVIVDNSVFKLNADKLNSF